MWIKIKEAELKRYMPYWLVGGGGHKLDRGNSDLASCQASLNSVKQFQGEKSKMSQPTRGQGGHLVFFAISLKNTNLIEDIQILLSTKLR